jgi:hypothetical protein
LISTFIAPLWNLFLNVAFFIHPAFATIVRHEFFDACIAVNFITFASVATIFILNVSRFTVHEAHDFWTNGHFNTFASVTSVFILNVARFTIHHAHHFWTHGGLFRAALTARKGFITPTKFWVFVAVATAVAILPFIHSWAEHGVFWHVFLTILLVIGHVFLSWLTRHLRTIVVVIALGIFSFELGTLVSHNNANLIDYILVIFRPNINNIATIHEFQLDRGHFSSRRLRI